MDTVPGGMEPELLLRDVSWVQALSRQLVRDAGSAEDIAQETWLAALGRVWPAGTPSRRWLAHVARNVARSRARGDAHRRAREQDAEHVRVVASPEELVARMETQRKLAEAVIALPEPYRTTILLRYVESLEPAEIAERLSIPAATVRSRALRGLDLLREELDRRSRGDRTQWLSAMVAITGSSSRAKTAALVAGGVLAVKWIAASIAGLVVIVSVWLLSKPAAPPSRSEPVASAPAASQPVDRPSATPPALREPEHAAARVDAAAAPIPHAEAAFFTCRLVDEKTAEPVPHLHVALIAPDGAREDVESDEHGILRASKTGARTALTIDLAGERHPSDLVQTKSDEAKAVPSSVRVDALPDNAAAPLDVKVPVGPTYSFTLALPPGRSAGDFTATLMSADPKHAFDRLYANLHDGDRFWVRFSPQARAMSGGPLWKVHLGSEDGLWSGFAETDRNQGIVTPPLTIAFESTGRVRGLVKDGAGAIEAGQFVQLWRAGASFQDARNRPIIVLTDAEGRYDARHVPPGAYTIKLEIVGSVDFEGHVDVLGGGTQAFDVALVPEARDGSIAVRVTSTTGRYAGDARVGITSQVGVRKRESKPVVWSAEGPAQIGRVRFESLQRARHTFDLILPDGTPVSPRRLDAETDGSEIAFVVLDETPMRELTFDLRDADTGDPVVAKTFRVLMPGTAGEDASYALVDKKTHATRLPDAPQYDVDVLADGYRPLHVHMDRPKDDAPIALKARKGWGIEVTTVEVSNAPLAGVHIECDGVDVGVTDGKGKANVEFDTVPTTLRGRLEGWRVHKNSDVDPETGRFRAWLPWVRVVMEKVPR